MADAEINETPFSYRPMYEEEDGTWQPPRFAEDSFCGDGASTSRQPQRHFIYEPSPMQLALTQPSRKRHLDDENEDEDTIRSKIRSGDYELVEFQEPGNWVTLVYYEEGVQCVKPCDVHSQYFLVDGFTCSTTDKDNRLSLGYLNNVRRSKDISEFRNLISRGIRLYYLGGESIGLRSGEEAGQSAAEMNSENWRDTTLESLWHDERGAFLLEGPWSVSVVRVGSGQHPQL
ncbi:unnamed protein product [Caenorhabditis auriculariae]|uniref:MH2 domain-containing protein n=1 Tax=Caenorhabditis auriculariae TaxID=2777116 RepID=A0A8S1HRT5_9PELO|nr:unnamed protein product [Caenorhabditis auriculariae]